MDSLRKKKLRSVGSERSWAVGRRIQRTTHFVLIGRLCTCWVRQNRETAKTLEEVKSKNYGRVLQVTLSQDRTQIGLQHPSFPPKWQNQTNKRGNFHHAAAVSKSSVAKYARANPLVTFN